MKFIVSILCLGVASASPQGFGGLGISGQQNFQQNFNIQQGFCGEPGFGGMQGAGCRAGQERQTSTAGLQYAQAPFRRHALAEV